MLNFFKKLFGTGNKTKVQKVQMRTRINNDSGSQEVPGFADLLETEMAMNGVSLLPETNLSDDRDSNENQ